MDYNGARRFLDTLPDWEAGNPHPGAVEDYLPRTQALLGCLGDPQLHFRTLLVGGTNGKGTVCSLAAALSQDAGYRTGLFISPHLHTLRERIQIDGQLLSRDLWVEGVSTLFDRTRSLSYTNAKGSFSKFEALTVLAAHLFATQGVEIAVFEVGLGGRYDATNAWDADTSVLTSISLDHTAILGNDLSSIAAEKLCIARPHRSLLTTSRQAPEVVEFLHRECDQRQILLLFAGNDGVEVKTGVGAIDDIGRRHRPYRWDPLNAVAKPAAQQVARPRSYSDSARLAIAAVEEILPQERVPSAERVQQIVEHHRWPGRFEVVQEDAEPPLVLDGAHNPAAAAALVEDLGAFREGEWTMIVGVNAGHDAQGILKALSKAARRLILTASDHPKAMSTKKLRDLAPAGVPVGEYVNIIEAIDSVAEDDSPLCITGSLNLVARAREYLNLRFEREGISEEVALESLVCVEAACRKVGLESERVSENGNVLRVQGSRGPAYFLRNKHPFNDYVSGRLAEDKGYQHELFAQSGVPVPQTLQLFNPYADDRFNRYKTHRSISAMVDYVQEHLDYPVVVKKYRSSVSQGVYLERNGEVLANRLQGLFEHSSFLDNTVMIQEYIDGPELRVVASQGELLLAYEKQGDGTDAGDDLNPLHGSTGMAVRVEDDSTLKELSMVCDRIHSVLDLGFYAVDLIWRQGPVVLELNPNPFCYFYNQANGRAAFVQIYETLLNRFLGLTGGTQVVQKERPPSAKSQPSPKTADGKNGSGV